METLRQDLRYGVRGFSRQPGFALVVVVVLTLCIARWRAGVHPTEVLRYE